MAKYRLTADPRTIIRTEDNAAIPDHQGNRDWLEFQAWKDEGGVPDPAEEEPTEDNTKPAA